MPILANKGFEGKEPEDAPGSVHHLARPAAKRMLQRDTLRARFAVLVRLLRL